MAEQLGPLQRVGDRWVIGDSTRAGCSWLVLTEDGMEHHGPMAPRSRAVLPWSRIVDLDVRSTQWAWMASSVMEGMTAFGPGEFGRRACSVRALVRDPYEDWSARYTHHKHSYAYGDIGLLGGLFAQAAEAKAAHRLGDPHWLDAAVTRVTAAGSISGVIEELGV
ncbi:hypothetical protein [Streptomyces formicae]